MKTAALLLCYRLFRRVLRFEAKASSHTRPRKQSTTPGPFEQGAKRTGRVRACLVPISAPLSTGRQAAVQVTPFGFANAQ